MKNLSIRIKLILLFILIKIFPLVIISYIAYESIVKLDSYMKNSTDYLYSKNKEILLNTANESIKDSIKNLDKQSQTNLEKLTLDIANRVANLLYSVDKDLLFLSKLDLNDKVLRDFFDIKKRKIFVHGKYIFDDKTNTWILENQIKQEDSISRVVLKDNEREFNYLKPIKFNTKEINKYKEITYFDLNGKEIYKTSTIDTKKLNISKKSNTYINSETYFNEIKDIKSNEIYVSDVIGKYIGTKIIGSFTKNKAKELNIAFEPENYAYAGKENPNGKRFEGIIRFVTPVFKENKKVGYLSLALDHRHVMELTDSAQTIGSYLKTDIADAKRGNYAFMWDYLGRNISHARDYFIYGYDENSGKSVIPWLSSEISEKIEKTNMDTYEFLEKYPTYDNQTLKKKPTMSQVTQDGIFPLDCRYLNFAPQCHGWRELVKDGGHGSFIIFWSGVWKLTTAAAIPYYTGKYGNSKLGFGFVTIGANVEEFHEAANKTRENVNKILNTQNDLVKDVVEQNAKIVESNIKKIINELSVYTVIMILMVIFIALWLSNYISSKIENLIFATKKISKNSLDYRIDIKSKDEIGQLELAFNKMASKIEDLIGEKNSLNENLEEKVEEKTKELILMNENLEKRVNKAVFLNRQKDAQLIQNNKMATMGEMISMIIHQWKQPLNAISMISSAQELRIMLGINTIENTHKDNEDIKYQVKQLTETIENFRNFFKNDDIHEYNVSSMILKSIKLVQKIFNYQGIFIVFDIKQEYEDLNTIGFENELVQVLINLFNNSRDQIIENKPSIDKIFVNIEQKKEELFIFVDDYAGGINNDLKGKIFDAYFTTKEEDKGTGLGLYMTKTIIEKVNGRLELIDISKIDDKGINQKGIRFKIVLKKA